MNKEDHVDPEIFIRNGVYTVYAEEFLDPEQIDEIYQALMLDYSVGAWSGSFHIAGFGGVDTVL